MNIYEIVITERVTNFDSKGKHNLVKKHYKLIAAKTGEEATEKIRESFIGATKEYRFSKPNCIINNK